MGAFSEEPAAAVVRKSSKIPRQLIRRKRAQDGSFAVVGKREERAYEIENRKLLRKREDKRV